MLLPKSCLCRPVLFVSIHTTKRFRGFFLFYLVRKREKFKKFSFFRRAVDMDAYDLLCYTKS